MPRVIKTISLIFAALLMLSFAACLDRNEETHEKQNEFGSVWDTYEELLRIAEAYGKYDTSAYECHIDCSRESQSFYFGWDENGNVTKNLKFVKTENGYKFSFNGGEFAETETPFTSAVAVCTDLENDSYVLLLSETNKTDVYSLDDGVPILNYTLKGRANGYYKGTLMADNADDQWWIDCYELNGDGVYSKTAAVNRSQGSCSFLVDGELKAYSRNGEIALLPGTVLKQVAFAYISNDLQNASYYIDEFLGVCYCTVQNKTENAFESCPKGMHPLELGKLTEKEIYDLVYYKDDIAVDIDSFESMHMELQKTEFNASFALLDIDGDGTAEHISKEAASELALDGTSSVISVNESNKVSCPDEIEYIAIPDADDDYADFIICGGMRTYLYCYKDGVLQLADILLGELYGRTAGGFICLYRENNASEWIISYKYELAAEWGKSFLASRFYKRFPEKCRVILDFEAYSKNGIIIVPEGSEITVLWEKQSPSCWDRIIVFSLNGEEAFAILTDGYLVNGKLGWDEYVTNQCQ